MPRMAKRFLVLLIDAAFCVLTVWLAFYLRLGEFLPLSGTSLWRPSASVMASLVIAIPLFIVSGLYRSIFRYNGLPALVSVSKSMLIYGLIYASVFYCYGCSGCSKNNWSDSTSLAADFCGHFTHVGPILAG